MILESNFANCGNKLSAGGQLEQPSEVKSSSTATGAKEPFTDLISLFLLEVFVLETKLKPIRLATNIMMKNVRTHASYEADAKLVCQLKDRIERFGES
jgi:hypothetical protein